jgi:hypothetical protein
MTLATGLESTSIFPISAGANSCISPCMPGSYRDSGTVSSNVTIVFDFLRHDLVSASTKAGIASVFATVLVQTHGVIGALVEITDVRGSGTFDSEFDFTVLADQTVFEELSQKIQDSITSRNLIEQLQQNMTATFSQTNTTTIVSDVSRSTGTMCKSCHDTCETCAGRLSTNCLSCQLPLVRFDTTCVPQCPVGTFFDSEANSCLHCPPNCQDCVNSKFCTVCSTDLDYRLENGICIDSANNVTILSIVNA